MALIAPSQENRMKNPLVLVFACFLVACTGSVEIVNKSSDSTTEVGGNDAASSSTTSTTSVDESDGGGGSGGGGSGGEEVDPCQNLMPLEVKVSNTNSDMLVAPGNWWPGDQYFFTAYDVCNPNDVEVTLSDGVIQQQSENGTHADFTQVGWYVFVADPIATGQLSPEDQSFAFNPDGNAILPPKTCWPFQTMGWLDVPMPYATFGDDHNYPHSGDRPNLVLTKLHATACADDLDVNIESTSGSARPLYASLPKVVIEPNSEPLVNGLNTLATIHVWSHGSSAVGFKNITVQIERSDGVVVTDDGINPWLLNGKEVEKSACNQIMKPVGWQSTFCLPDKDLVHNPAVDYAAHTLVLRGVVSGVVSGSYVKVSFNYDPNLGWQPNMILTGVYSDGSIVGHYPDQMGGPPVGSPIIWTDFSEGFNHKPTFPTSRDYIGMYLVTDPQAVSLLTAN